MNWYKKKRDSHIDKYSDDDDPIVIIRLCCTFDPVPKKREPLKDRFSGPKSKNKKPKDGSFAHKREKKKKMTKKKKVNTITDELIPKNNKTSTHLKKQSKKQYYVTRKPSSLHLRK